MRLERIKTLLDDLGRQYEEALARHDQAQAVADSAGAHHQNPSRTPSYSSSVSSSSSSSSSPLFFLLFFWMHLFCVQTTKEDDPQYHAETSNHQHHKLYAAILRAAYNRGTSQLRRHFRYVSSLRNILSSHPLDVSIAAKEVAAIEMEPLEDALTFDLTYQLLSRQHTWLLHIHTTRRGLRTKQMHDHVAAKTASPHSDRSQQRNATCPKMQRLLEAASWYRLVRRRRHSSSIAHFPLYVQKEGSTHDDKNDLWRYRILMDILSGDDFYAEYQEWIETDETKEVRM